MWYLIKKIFGQLWRILTGAFYLGWRMKERERKEQELDIGYYFKQETRKKMARWQVKEQMRMRKMSKSLWWMPKKFNKQGHLFHNYFSTVLLNPKPNETPAAMLTRYWEECVGPYFMIQRELLKQLEDDVRTVRDYTWETHPSGSPANLKLKEIFAKLESLPDLEVHANTVMEAHKKILADMRRKAERLKEDRQKALDERDKEMLDIDEKILDAKVQKAQESLKGIRQARKGAEGMSGEGPKKDKKQQRKEAIALAMQNKKGDR